LKDRSPVVVVRGRFIGAEVAGSAGGPGHEVIGVEAVEGSAGDLRSG
jgi:hypothetical protein